MTLQSFFASVDRLNIPVLLQPHNFTPEQRTPWGGYGIAKYFKKHLEGTLIACVPDRIGESWEFSLDPDFPSKALIDGSLLDDILKKFATDIFSPTRVNRGQANCRILVKLLEAKDPLSLQVHPADDDFDLKQNECGKPESWLVLRAEKGAGLYLGFNQKISKDELRKILLDRDSAKRYLHFHEAKPGDYFEIKPGVPHAVGPGVVVLEPQRVLPGLSGKTFRLWDWGRTYNGKARELHIEEGLKLVNPLDQVGPEFVKTLMRQPQIQRVEQGTQSYTVSTYPFNEDYQTVWIKGKSRSILPCTVSDGFAILTVLGGKIKLLDKHKNSFGEHESIQNCQMVIPEFILQSGMTALLPNSIFPLHLELQDEVECVLIVPSLSKLEFLK